MAHDERRPTGEIVEVERYELFEAPRYHFAVDRREFLKLAAGGIVVLIAAPGSRAQESGGGRRAGPDAAPADVNAWLRIDRDGKVTVYTGKVEVGQNARTSLTQAVVEELRLPGANVSLVMGDTSLTPYDMGTFGSRTTPLMSPQLRRAAAAAREILVGVAAGKWGVDRATLTARDGRVTEAQGTRAAGYGELADGQALVRAIDGQVELTPADQWRVCGTSLPKVNARDIVTGRHKYTSDTAVDGMLHGKVLRPLRLGDTLESVDTGPASHLPGVSVVRDGDFIGVTAPTVGQAVAARNALKPKWRTTPQPSSRELAAILRKTARNTEGSVVTARSGEAFKGGAKVFEGSYTAAYIAHAPLEPRAAVAWWSEGKTGTLTVLTGTQRPFGVQSELAEAFRISPEQVRVQVPDTGSGYGGKHTGDAAVEAARLARAAGKPVRLVWTREEEFIWAYFRPAAVIDVKSAVAKDGRLTAWEFHNYNAGTAGLATPYSVTSRREIFHACQSPLRQGSYRGLAATANHFARETHMDELAHLLALDPLEMRLRNLENPRMRAVLEAAAKRFGWGTTPAANHGIGISAGFEKGGYVATCAEVAVEPRTQRVRVVRLVAAFECGAIVNPDGLRNQVEGSLVQGLGGALFEAVHFNNGQIIESNFGDYRVPRFSDTPEIDVVLLNRTDLPSAGAGETPIVGVAPAIGNAMFKATRNRVRDMPLAPKPLVVGTGQ